MHTVKLLPSKGLCDICHQYRERTLTSKEQLLLCDECRQRFLPEPTEGEATSWQPDPMKGKTINGQ